MRERQFEALRVEGEGSGRRHARRRLLRFEIQLAQPLVFVRRAPVLLLQFPDAAPLLRLDPEAPPLVLQPALERLGAGVRLHHRAVETLALERTDWLLGQAPLVPPATP